jgi:hypothetical protein
MAINPLNIMKQRLSAAIDWRVRQEFEKERDLLTGISESVVDISVTYADEISTLTKAVSDLEQRLKNLEK